MYVLKLFCPIWTVSNVDNDVWEPEKTPPTPWEVDKILIRKKYCSRVLSYQNCNWNCKTWEEKPWESFPRFWFMKALGKLPELFGNITQNPWAWFSWSLGRNQDGGVIARRGILSYRLREEKPRESFPRYSLTMLELCRNVSHSGSTCFRSHNSTCCTVVVSI